MKTRNLIASATIAVFCFGGLLHAQSKSQDKMTTPQSFSRSIAQTARGDYLLFLPRGFNTKPGRRPLILFLHGAGERGEDVSRANVHGPIKYIANHPDFPFILVSPLCPADQTWSNEVLLALLDEIVVRYRADPQRVYLTGLSMGGYGTWSLAAAHPEKFAAVAPICGGGDILTLMLAAHGFSSPEKKEALKNLPIWVFHGAKDTVVPISESERMIGAAKKLGVREVKFTVYPEAQHDCWSETYSNPELYEWFLKHARSGAE